jgi:hypothetical protein
MTYDIIRKALRLRKQVGVYATACFLKKNGVTLEYALKVCAGRFK